VPRNYKRRAPGEPRPQRPVTTLLTSEELAEVDRRADAVGLSRSALLREALLAGGDVSDVLRATIADLETQVAYHSGHAAGLEAQLAAAHELRARDVAGLRGLLDGRMADEPSGARSHSGMPTGERARAGLEQAVAGAPVGGRPRAVAYGY
jgi:hypothetical protein